MKKAKKAKKKKEKKEKGTKDSLHCPAVTTQQAGVLGHARSNPFGAGSRLFSVFPVFAQPEGIKCTVEMHSLVPPPAHQTYVSLQSLQSMAICAASASLSSCSPALPAECGEGGAQPNNTRTPHTRLGLSHVFSQDH